MQNDADNHDDPLSFSEKELVARTWILVEIRGFGDDGKQYFAYTAVRAPVLPSLIEAQLKGSFDVRDYGVVLEAGIGEPDAAMRSRVQELYGYDPDSAIVLGNSEES